MRVPRELLRCAAAVFVVTLVADPARAAPPQAPTPVEIQPVARVALAEEETIVGTVAPRQEARIPALVAGAIVSWEVREGEFRPRGKPILQLAPDELDHRLAAAGARLEESRAKLEAERALARRADLDLGRTRSLVGEELATEAAYERAVAERAVSEARIGALEAQVAERQAELARARLARSRATVRAPFDGMLRERLREIGERVSAGDQVGVWSSAHDLEVRLDVGDATFPDLGVGLRAAVEADAFPDRRFAGRIDRLVERADPETRTFPVYVALDPPGENGGARLFAGLQVRVTIEGRNRPERLVVHRDAIVFRGNARVVYEVAAGDGTAIERRVRLGLARGDLVEIRAGLASGARVVVTGNEGLRDGSPIAIRGQRPAPASTP